MRRSGASVCDVFPSGLQEQLWLGDGFDALTSAVVKDGDPGAAAVVEAVRSKVRALPARPRMHPVSDSIATRRTPRRSPPAIPFKNLRCSTSNGHPSPVPLPGDPAPIAHVCYCIPRAAD
ncbi:hypothetical protein D7S92_09435 [Burkholderia contaminans]|nr:hypothetical protein [Burkholderia contaminans]MBA9906011.1 hypothetical protein [Burkholderia contaminans]